MRLLSDLGGKMRPKLVLARARVRLKRERVNSSNLGSLKSHNWCATNDDLEDGVLEAAEARQSVSPSAPSRRAAAACSESVLVSRRGAPDKERGST